jgi:hypothetical protein
MFPYIALSKDKTWQPGPYEGVELMILHTHENSGGVVVLRKFKAGYTIPAHTHPDANEWAYVLSGEWERIGHCLHCRFPVLCPQRRPSRSTRRAHGSHQPDNF